MGNKQLLPRTFIQIAVLGILLSACAPAQPSSPPPSRIPSIVPTSNLLGTSTTVLTKTPNLATATTETISPLCNLVESSVFPNDLTDVSIVATDIKNQINISLQESDINLWHSINGQLLTTLSLAPYSLFDVELSVVTNLIAASAPPRITVWDTLSSEELWTKQNPVAGFGPITFSEDGVFLAAATYLPSGEYNNNYFVSVYNALSGKQLAGKIRTNSQPSALRFSQDNRLLAIGETSGVVQLWEWANKTLVVNFETNLPDWVNTITFSPNNNLFIASIGGLRSESGLIKLWNVEEQNEGFIFPGKYQPVTAMAVHPTTNVLLTAHSEGNILLWDINQGLAIGECLQFTSWVHTILLSSEEDAAWIGTADGTLHKITLP